MEAKVDEADLTKQVTTQVEESGNLPVNDFKTETSKDVEAKRPVPEDMQASSQPA